MEWMCWIWERNCNIDGMAAWVQAFLSVGAIFYAGWAARASERKIAANNTKLATIFIMNIQAQMESMLQACERQDSETFNQRSNSLQREIETYPGVDHSIFPYRAVIALRNIRDEAERIVRFGPVTQFANWEHYGNNIKNALTQINAHFRSFQDATNFVKSMKLWGFKE